METDPEGANPFVLPADEEVFRMREQEKPRKARERIARREQKVLLARCSSSASS